MTLLCRVGYFLKDGYNPTFQLSTIIPPSNFGEWKGFQLIYDSIPMFRWEWFQDFFWLVQIILDFIYYSPLELGIIFCCIGCAILSGIFEYLDGKINKPTREESVE